jgi:hypothetical protein
MPDFATLPHFGIVLTGEGDRYVHEIDGALIVADRVAHGWQLSFAATDGETFSVVVEGRTLAEAEAALVKAMGRAEDVLTAALMQVSVECRHSGEVAA